MPKVNKLLKQKIEKSPYPTKGKFHHSTFKHAIQGFTWAYKTQPNLQIDVFATCNIAVFNTILVYFKLLSLNQFFIVMGVCLLLISAELFNTSLEALSDEVAKGVYKEFIRIAKDTAAAAVFVLFVFAAIIGAYIYIPLLFRVVGL